MSFYLFSMLVLNTSFQCFQKCKIITISTLFWLTWHNRLDSKIYVRMHLIIFFSKIYCLENTYHSSNPLPPSVLHKRGGGEDFPKLVEMGWGSKNGWVALLQWDFSRDSSRWSIRKNPWCLSFLCWQRCAQNNCLNKIWDIVILAL